MKAGTKPDKGQKSISSFFFKPKTGTAPKLGQPKKQQQQQQQQRVLGEKQAAQAPPSLTAPAKRQRLSDPITLEPDNDEGQPTPVCSKALHQSSALVAEPDVHAANNLGVHTVSTADRHAAQQQVPTRTEHRHQRFQQKLVVGAGNKAQGHARGMPAVAKPKYTPLELQIVELKDKHPGVLLIVEVCFSIYRALAEIRKSITKCFHHAGWIQNAFLWRRCRYCMNLSLQSP